MMTPSPDLFYFFMCASTTLDHYKSSWLRKKDHLLCDFNLKYPSCLAAPEKKKKITGLLALWITGHKDYAMHVMTLSPQITVSIVK